MLFILVMETLNALISAAESYNLLKTIDPKVKCWAFLYADDVVIFVQPEERQLVALRAILEVFAAASVCTRTYRSARQVLSNAI